MRTLITAALAAALLLPTAGYAQKLVRQESIRALPDPVLLDTSGITLFPYTTLFRSRKSVV